MPLLILCSRVALRSKYLQETTTFASASSAQATSLVNLMTSGCSNSSVTNAETCFIQVKNVINQNTNLTTIFAPDVSNPKINSNFSNSPTMSTKISSMSTSPATIVELNRSGDCGSSVSPVTILTYAKVKYRETQIALIKI